MENNVSHLGVRILTTLLVAAVVTLAAGSGLLYYLDNVAGDYLYQRPQAGRDDIAVIGIDAYALEELGPWPWPRDVMADVINMLNSDPECRPAAIGVDVIFEGETDPEADAWLAEAASAGNVVLGCGVQFDSQVAEYADGRVELDRFGVRRSNLPFPALREAAPYGHTNAMYDQDGVLRHHLWSVKTETGERLPSMPYLLYSKYCSYWNIRADFEPPLTNKGFWWVDYAAEPGDFYSYSVSDILYGNYDADQLRGAIVLIGPYDSGLTDKFLTAASRAENMYGVEYLANVTDAMVRGAAKTEVHDGIQLAALFVIVALLGTAGCFLALHWVIFISILSLGGSALGALGLYAGGYVVHPLWVPAGIFLIFLTTVIERYLITRSEKKRIIRTFEKYQDPAVIKELLRVGITDEELNGQTKEVAVLFVDIRGFTTLSERMAPDQVVAILNEYLTLTSRSVMKCGGTLDKFIGDCTMAFWGAPLPCEDKAYQACRAAMMMAEGADELAKRMRERFHCDVFFGIGVHMGPAVIGNIGSPERKDYTAIGDTVNTASRLEANAPPGTIYISRAVADALGDRAVATPLKTPIKLKGKAEGFEILTLDALY